MLERRFLTQLVIDTMKTVGKPVGDANVPDEPYGWSQTATSPSSIFTPYLIVTPGSVSEIKGSFADDHADLWVPYNISGFGSSREQCEWMLDHARDAIDGIRKTVIDAKERYKISALDVKNIGGIVRSGDPDTPVFGQTDIHVIFLSKEL